MKLPRRRFLQLAASAPALPALCRVARAETYPSRPVHLLVGYAAGGVNDIVARLTGQMVSERLGQQFIIEDRPGAGSNLATEAVVRASPDGYTLLEASTSNAWNATLYQNLKFDFIRDIAPVASTVKTYNVMIVNPSFPARTVPELIAYAKANPGKINMGSAGPGSSPHLYGELFKAMTGINMLHIPYRGAGASVTDLLGGHVELAFVSLSSVVTQLKANRLRALAVTSARRSALMPDLPTFAEAGLTGYEVTGWYGVLAPAGTPREIIDRLHADITKALAQPEVVQTLSASGIEPAGANSPEEFTAYLRAEIIKWAKVVKASGARAD